MSDSSDQQGDPTLHALGKPVAKVMAWTALTSDAAALIAAALCNLRG